jgi:hypothetical protein
VRDPGVVWNRRALPFHRLELVGKLPEDCGHGGGIRQGKSDQGQDQQDERPTGQAKTSVRWIAKHPLSIA